MVSLLPNMPPPSGVYSIIRSESSPAAVPALIRTSGSLFSMSNKIAIVTGGGRGIGLEIAVAYAESGATVYCLDLAELPSTEWEKCRMWVEGLSPMSAADSQGRLEYAQCNVTQQKAVRDLFQKIADNEGDIHVCVACAGIVQTGDVLEYEEEAFEKVMKVNVSGVLFTAQAAARQMVSRNIKGSIVLIASMAGSATLPGFRTTAYNTSKSAVLQLSRSIACELGPRGVRCNTISPGWVYSDMTKDYIAARPDILTQNPLGRVANLDEIRGAALFLGSDASTFCTGSDVIVDGGQTAW